MLGAVPSELFFDLAELSTEKAVRKFEQAGCLQVSNFLPTAKIDVLAKAVRSIADRGASAAQSIQVGPRRHMISLPVAEAFNDVDLYAPTALRGFLSQTLGHDFLLSCFTCVLAQGRSARSA